MTGIFTSAAMPGKPRCARCGRPFMPKKEGDRYGKKCARKLADQLPFDGHALVSSKVLRKKKAPQNEMVCRVCGCTDFSPCPGGCAWIEPDLCSACATDAQIRKKIRMQMSAQESAVAAYRRAVIP